MMTFDDFITKLTSNSYASDSRARQALSRCTFGVRAKSMAQKAIEAHYDADVPHGYGTDGNEESSLPESPMMFDPRGERNEEEFSVDSRLILIFQELNNVSKRTGVPLKGIIEATKTIEAILGFDTTCRGTR